MVSCEIAIGTPKFLPVMTCILDSNGEKVLSDLLGGCEIGFAMPNKLTFKGTVHQYNNLKLMLDITQYNVSLFSFFLELCSFPGHDQVQ